MTTRTGHGSTYGFSRAGPPTTTTVGPTTLNIPLPSTAPPSNLRNIVPRNSSSGNGNINRFGLSSTRPAMVTQFDRYKGPDVVAANAARLTPVPPPKHAVAAATAPAFMTPTAAAPPVTKTTTTTAFQRAPPGQQAEEDKVDLRSCLRLLQLQVQGNSMVWPCLAFSKYGDAQRLHCELYPKQKVLSKTLLQMFSRKELLGQTLGKSNGSNGNFKVVLPLSTAAGCCGAPFQADTPFYDIDPSSYLAASRDLDLIDHYDGLYEESPPGSTRHFALLEYSRLLAMADGDGSKKRPRDEPTTFKFEEVKPSVIRTSEVAADTETATNLTTNVAKPMEHPFPIAPRPQKRQAAPSVAATAAAASAETPSQTPVAVQNESVGNQPLAENSSSVSRRRPSTTNVATAKPRKNNSRTKRAASNTFQTPQPTKAGKSAKKMKTTAKVHKFKRDSAKKAPQKNEWDEKPEEIEIAPWKEVHPILELFGYEFDRNLFCRPNGNPNKYSDAVEGEDYFTNLQDFRKFLCIHGVDYVNRFPLERKDKVREQKVARWVRYSIVSSVRDAGPNKKAFPYFKIRSTTAQDSLEHRGVIVRGQKWSIPWSNPPVVGDIKDIEKYLGEHGIPEEFETKMESNERVAVQFYLADQYEKQNTMFVRYERRESPAPSIHTPVPEAGKDALEAATRAPPTGGHATPRDPLQPRQLLSEEESEKSPLGTEENDASHVDRTDPTEPNQPAEYNVPASKPVAAMDIDPTTERDCADAGDEQSSVDKSKAHGSNEKTAAAKEAETVEDAVVIPGVNIGEKLQGCLDALRTQDDDEIVASGNLSVSHDQIRKFLASVIKSKGRKGGRLNAVPPILYICGAPGTGKTMSTTQLCNEAIAENSKNLQDWEKPAQVSYINCTGLQGFGKQDALDKILAEVGTMKRSTKDKDAAFAAILILDEVDTMFGSKGLEEAFEKLADWARDERTVLSLIGISNSINNSKTSRMLEFGMGGNKIVFQRYRKEEMVEITNAKIGFSVVDRKAMEFVAAKVAATTGDARKYLDLMARAIIHCRDKMSHTKLSEALVKPVVTIKDAMMAIRQTNTKYKDIIDALTMVEKVTLCTGVHIARKFDGKEVTMTDLRSIVIQSFGIEYDLDMMEFKGVLERLIDSGLVVLPEEQMRKIQRGMAGWDLGRCPLRFDLQLEDVESALDEFIEKEPWYRKIVDRVKSIQVNDY